MGNWKVSREKIQIFTHPSADLLQIGKVGSYQVVVQKGLYNDGDEVIFAPEKSVLSGRLKTEYEKYLVGPDKNRVKAVRLRNEVSSGIIIPREFVENFENYSLGEDISNDLDIIHYEPPIPIELSGKVKRYDMPYIGSHDCEQAGIYVNEIIDGERVVITEKIHGSQFILAHNMETNETIVSSKGLLKSGLIIEESDSNAYWRASKNDKLIEKIKNSYTQGVIQIFAEVIPIQSGYTYGQTEPTVRIFDVRLNEISLPYDTISDELKAMWVPVIYDGVINLDKKEIVLYENIEKGIRKTKIEYLLPKSITDLCKGKELVSGHELHIREGIVLRPYIDRDAKDGIKLRLKIINPNYKESGEEIN